MKFLLIVALAIIGLALDQVACDSSSSEEAYSVDVNENELSDFARYPAVYNPHRIIIRRRHTYSNCHTCTVVVTYVNQYGGSSVYSRNNALHNACSHVGLTYLNACQHFVQVYGQQLTHYLRPHGDALSSCRMIHVC